MLPEERKNYICEIINTRGVVRVSDLSRELELTEATIRRDLEELQRDKKVKRTHGGAVAVLPVGTKYVIRQLSLVHAEEKKAIAECAYDFIDAGDTMIMDASSTVQELCKAIVAGDKKDLTVVTNSFSVVRILSECDDITVIHTGGILERKTDSCIGDIAIKDLPNMKVDKVFLGVNGIDVKFGYSITNLSEARVKQEMIKSAKQVYILADSSKFEKTFLAKIAEFYGNVDYLITEKRVKHVNYTPYEDAVQLVVANEYKTG